MPTVAKLDAAISGTRPSDTTTIRATANAMCLVFIGLLQSSPKDTASCFPPPVFLPTHNGTGAQGPPGVNGGTNSSRTSGQ
jgi:hypothetical protein